MSQFKFGPTRITPTATCMASKFQSPQSGICSPCDPFFRENGIKKWIFFPDNNNKPWILKTACVSRKPGDIFITRNCSPTWCFAQWYPATEKARKCHPALDWIGFINWIGWWDWFFPQYAEKRSNFREKNGPQQKFRIILPDENGSSNMIKFF